MFLKTLSVFCESLKSNIRSHSVRLEKVPPWIVTTCILFSSSCSGQRNFPSFFINEIVKMLSFQFVTRPINSYNYMYSSYATGAYKSVYTCRSAGVPWGWPSHRKLHSIVFPSCPQRLNNFMWLVPIISTWWILILGIFNGSGGTVKSHTRRLSLLRQASVACATEVIKACMSLKITCLLYIAEEITIVTTECNRFLLSTAKIHHFQRIDHV